MKIAWEKSGRKIFIGDLIRSPKLPNYLVIAARLERATYCLEGRSSSFQPISSVAEKTGIYLNSRSKTNIIKNSSYHFNIVYSRFCLGRIWETEKSIQSLKNTSTNTSMVTGGRMKFFKHFTDADRGSLHDIMNRKEFGVASYGRYWLFIEMCVQELEKEPQQEFTLDQMRFTFTSRQLREKLRIKQTNLRHLLDIWQTEVVLLYTCVEDKFNFYVPNILNSIDRDSKRARTERAMAAPKKKKENKKKSIDGSSAFVAQTFLDLWNSAAHPDLPKVLEIKGRRLSAASARWAENPSREYWSDVISKLNERPFCVGQNDRGWKANIDWLIKPDTATKILEGMYQSNQAVLGGFSELIP